MTADTIKIQDRILLSRAIHEKDRNALGLLHSTYYPRIKRYIASRVDLAEDVEDLAQSVFFELCKGDGTYKAYHNAEAYLLGIAKNLIALHYRSQSKQVKTISIESISEIAASDTVQSYQSSAKGISPQELMKIIEDARPPLLPKFRQALKLKFIKGYSPKEASQKVGCSVWTFYKRLDKAAKLLEAMIKGRH